MLPTTHCSLPAILLLGLAVPLAAPDNARGEQPPAGSSAELAERLAPVEMTGLRFEEPKLEVKRNIQVFPPEMKALWRRALARDEADLQRQAADAFARAHALGMSDLGGVARQLQAVLDRPDPHPLVQLSVARALVTLEARDAAPSLAGRLETGGLDYARIVEPALARWGYDPPRPVWRERAGDERSLSGRRMLAVRCLGLARDAEAVPILERIAAARRESPGLRLEAARALANVRPESAARLAQALAERSPPGSRGGVPRLFIDRLAAATLLQTADGASERRLLGRLSEDPRPTIAALAIQRLLVIAPEDVIERADKLLDSQDAKVRLLTARCLATRPAPEQVERLAGRLADPHPDVRRFARATLREMAGREDLDPLVRDVVSRTLATQDWQSLEQAAQLSAELDHKPVVPRLVELLDHARAEVMLAAAWALRELAVSEPLPEILANARGKAEFLDGIAADHLATPQEALAINTYPDQLALLFELFGATEYRPAEDLLRKFVPKKPKLGASARSAAIWALGRLQAEASDEALAGLLAERLSDLNPLAPESDEVRRFSAVALGHMKAESQLPTLRKFYETDGDFGFIGRSCGWAISRITSQPLGDPGEREILRTGWFLEPLVPSAK